MVSLNATNINGHSLKSTENKIVKQSLKKSKYYLLCILILSISGLASLTAFIISRTHLTNKPKQLSENYQRQTELVYELTHFHRFQLKSNIKWKSNATTIVGGNQLKSPHGIYVDHQQKSVYIYIADWKNHRIVKWKLDENEGEIVAGENGKGNRTDQLNEPSDVIIDKNNKSLIICDKGNRRVIRWSLENQQDKQILIGNITCFGLMMNECGDLFVSDVDKHEVKRWRIGENEAEGTVVAGGQGKGNNLNQLNWPSFLFIDRKETIYVSDRDNHRVMKWLKGAKEGIIVAGGQGPGHSLNQLFGPLGLIVNEVGDIYVADCLNHRIMCWPFGSKEGRIVVGGNGEGEGSHQFKYPTGLSFDVENNLYVVDSWNHRIQRFSVDRNEKKRSFFGFKLK